VRKEVTLFLRNISKPVHLLGGVLVYTLGVSIARYLGTTIDIPLAIMGQIWVTSYQLGSHFLHAYFNHPVNPKNANRFLIKGDNDDSQSEIHRDLVLWGALTAFTALTSFTLIMLHEGSVKIPALVVMVLLVIISILYSVPPFTLELSGFGEISQSVIMASLIPGLGFILQRGELHRLVALSTFPLILLHLGMNLAHLLEKFPRDHRNTRKTILVRFGWERSMTLHNVLLMGYFLALGLSMVFGLPTSVGLPVFTAFPLAVFQVWYVNRISEGAKPNWRVLNLTAIFIFSLPVYLLVFRFLVQ
jgi:1,4-dihydroxy-2-naphthoate octaprenyltransferase